jgi:hypothetical protein
VQIAHRHHGPDHRGRGQVLLAQIPGELGDVDRADLGQVVQAATGQEGDVAIQIPPVGRDGVVGQSPFHAQVGQVVVDQVADR